VWGRHRVAEGAEQYWQRPLFKDQGDDDPDRLWCAIGSTASTWEQLEEAFATMFNVFVESKSPAAKRAYGAIASSRGRRDALDAAAEVFFNRRAVNEAWQSEFRLLMRHFSTASGLRNEVVHGVLVHFGFKRGPGAGNFLIPADYITRKTHAFERKRVEEGDYFGFSKAKYRYTANDVEDISNRIFKFGDCVREWTMNLWVTYPSDKHDATE
jgi:hypothetical protein